METENSSRQLKAGSSCFAMAASSEAADRLACGCGSTTPQHIELALKYGVDILWVGARTTVNPFNVQELADALKGIDVPVLVKTL